MMGDVFFVSVQSKRSLNTSGSSQAKTLQDKPTLKQFPTCIVVTLLHLSLLLKRVRGLERTLLDDRGVFWRADWHKVPPRPELRKLVGVESPEVVLI